MSEATKDIIRIALAGNPNSGKTTLFNALTGAHYKVGNYPGVTVEKREGSRVRNEREYRFIDLPGIYSLTAYSIDEVVTRDFLLDEKPDLIVDVLDSTNLERHLYLCLQFQELGIPVVGALNMTDEAEAKGIRIDEKLLSSVLGVPMAKTVGTKGGGVDGLLDLIDSVADSDRSPPRSERRETEARKDRSLRYGDEIEDLLSPIEAAIDSDRNFAAGYPTRWLAVKLLEKDSNAAERLSGHREAQKIRALAEEAVHWIERHYAKDAQIVVSEKRYGYIRGAVREAVSVVSKPDFSFTEAADRIVMNRFLALPIFAAALWSVFQITFRLGAFPMAWLEAFFAWLSGVVSSVLAEGVLKSLIVDGIIAGVGGVMSFVPLIIILFFLLSILEDIGYMSRAAFATDKLLHSFGLHGQSIFPMMLGFGCSVPAIMAARTLKSPRDRIVTILVIPFMSCGAKLPVHVLLAAAFFPKNPAAMVLLVYAIGVALALLSALLLKNTVLRGEATPFVMELPPYRAPTLVGIFWHVREKTVQYLKKAGTVILAASILIWAITAFPVYRPDAAAAETLRSTLALENPGADGGALSALVDTAMQEKKLEYSLAGRIGKFIEPVFRPLGFDWKIGVATVTGFAAKEVVVSTLAVLHRVASTEEDRGQGLAEALRKDPTFNPLVAFVLMLFTLLIPPCFAALATIRAELGWKWLGFAFAFMLGLGWVAGAAVYNIGLIAGALS